MVLELILLILIIWIVFSIIRSNWIIDSLRKIGDRILSKGGYNVGYNLRESSDASYTVFRKGATPIIMLKIWNNKGQMYSTDTLVEVLVHELAHVICPSSGHDEHFDTIEDHLWKTAEGMGYLDDDEN